MDKKRWAKTETLFEKAVDLPLEGRTRVLKQWCGGDEELFEEVSAMLFYHREEEYEQWLEQPVRDQAIQVIGIRERQRLPDVLGAYKVRDLLGRGGMGSVYLADVTEGVKRTVALKVIDSNEEEFLIRFDYEQQVLAKLQHPNIAQVYDTGHTRDGYPFFTMEYIDGPRLLDFCDAENLSIHDRLTLFLQVCEGVSHAHRKGIIHRDLKPSNILVVPNGGKAIPKIIDFGIALDVARGQLRPGRPLGTPAYMSPEAIKNQSSDTTTDVYSLGIVLYQLLSGRLPLEDELYRDFEPNRLLPLMETLPPASSRVEEGTNTAAARGLTAEKLKARLHGDLDHVVAKATAFDAGLRYSSIEELARDITRHLERKTVSARKPTLPYILGKAITRDYRITTSILSFFLALIFALVALLYGNHRLTEEKTQTDNMKNVSLQMLQYLDPRFNYETDNKLGEIASELIAKAVIDPSKKAEYRFELARVFNSISRQKLAREQLNLAIPVFEEEEKLDLLMTARLERAYAWLRDDSRPLEQKSVLAVEFNEIHTYAKETGNANLDRYSRLGLAEVLEDRERARQLFEELIEGNSPQGPEDSFLQEASINYGMHLMGGNRSWANCRKALILFQKAHQELMISKGEAHPFTMMAQHGIGWALLQISHFLSKAGHADKGKKTLQEAYFHTRKAMFLGRQAYGNGHRKTLESWNNYLIIAGQLGKFKERPNQLIEEWKNLYSYKLEVYGVSDTTALTLNNLANKLNNHGRAGEALPFIEECLATYETLGKPLSQNYPLFKMTYAEILYALKLEDLALDIVAEVKEQARRDREENTVNTANDLVYKWVCGSR